MRRYRVLNLADIWSFKKDLLWGKYYFGLFEKSKLLDSILYSNAYNNKRVVEIHNMQLKDKEFLQTFISRFTKKKKIIYFIRELDEVTRQSDIEFMQSNGFKRFNRNYCFEYLADSHSPNEKTQLSIFCREAEKYDVVKLMELDLSSQIIEYRDYLHKGKNFFRDKLESIYVFVDPNDMRKVLAYAFKKDLEHQSTFEFCIHPRSAELIFDCIHAFTEKYVHFEKNASSFRFIVNENIKAIIPDLSKKFDHLYTLQCLILEGCPKEKSKQVRALQITSPSRALE